MIVRKVRGQNKIDEIIMSRLEYESVKRMGADIQKYVEEQIIRIAKARRWKWYFDKERNNG